MVVRVKIELKRGNKIIKTSAVANSGFESSVPEIHIPKKLAKLLEFDLSKCIIDEYSATGTKVKVYILGFIDVRVITEDKVSNWVTAKAICCENEFEVLLSDYLIESLGIEILKPKSGIWKFTNEDKIRYSVEPEYWFE